MQPSCLERNPWVGIIDGIYRGFYGVGLLIVLHVHEIAMGILNGCRGAYLGKQHLLMVELDSRRGFASMVGSGDFGELVADLISQHVCRNIQQHCDVGDWKVNGCVFLYVLELFFGEVHSGNF